MTTEDHSTASELSTLAGGLLTLAGLLYAGLVASLSPWLTPLVGVVLVAIGLTGLNRRVPRVLPYITIAFGCVFLVLSLLAFAPE